MKKLMLLLGSCLLLMTGCGKKELICTGTVDEEGIKVNMEVTAKLDSDKVSEVSAVMSFDDVEVAKQYCSLFDLANSFEEDETKKIKYTCREKSIEFENYAQVVETDNDVKIINVTEEEFKKEMENLELSCK